MRNKTATTWKNQQIIDNAWSEKQLLIKAVKKFQGFVDGISSEDEPITVDELFVRESHLPALATSSSSQKTIEMFLLPNLFKTAVVIYLVNGSPSCSDNAC